MPRIALSCLLFLVAISSSQALIPTQDVTLAGTTFRSKWTNLTVGSNPGYPGFNDPSGWPTTISGGESANAQLNKISGTGNPGSGSLYVGGFGGIPNTLATTLSIVDTISGIDLQKVTFQITIGQAYGYDFYDGLKPVLNYNGGSQSLIAPVAVVVDQIQNGTFPDPVNGPQPVYITLYRLEWDLSAITDPISSIEIRWSAVEHSQIYALQLDEGGIAVPEPSSAALLMMGVGAIALLRRRKAAC